MPIDARPLNSDERRILAVMLSRDFPGADELRLQAAKAVVVGGCPCGCPTINLQVFGDDTLPAPVDSTTPVHGTVLGSDGQLNLNLVVGLILFVHHGYLSSLEIYWIGDAQPMHWPSATQVIELKLSEEIQQQNAERVLLAAERAREAAGSSIDGILADVGPRLPGLGIIRRR